MTTTQIIIGAIVSVLTIIGNGWLIWWKSYMQRDAEYKTMKENIAAITTLTESVKNDLSLIAHSKKSLIDEKRNSIIKYYELLNLWHSKVLAFPRFEQAQIFEHNKLTQIAYDKMNIADSHFHLIVDQSPEIIDAIGKTTESIFKLKSICLAQAKYYDEVAQHTITSMHEYEEFVETQLPAILEQEKIISAYKIVLRNLLKALLD